MADYIYTLTIPEANQPEMIQAFGKGWEAEIEVDGEIVPNPQTKALFALEFFDKYLKAMIHEKIMEHRRRMQPPLDGSAIVE